MGQLQIGAEGDRLLDEDLDPRPEARVAVAVDDSDRDKQERGVGHLLLALQRQPCAARFDRVDVVGRVIEDCPLGEDDQGLASEDQVAAMSQSARRGTSGVDWEGPKVPHEPALEPEELVVAGHEAQ